MVKLLAMDALTHCLPTDEIWGSSRPVRMITLDFSVIVTSASAADTEAEVLVACGIPECCLPLLLRHIWAGASSATISWCNKTHRGFYRWMLGNVWGGVVQHPAYAGGLTAGLGLLVDGLL